MMDRAFAGVGFSPCVINFDSNATDVTLIPSCARPMFVNDDDVDDGGNGMRPFYR